MASSSSRRTLLPCLALAIVLLFTLCEAREFLVGGRENSWKVPPSPDDLNNWSGRMRFLVGDSIVLKYDPKPDAVLEVTKEDYESCNISNPIKKYDDGNTKVVLDRWGPFYFISGAEGHCEGGQKLVVTVLSPKHGSKGQPPAVSLAPAPSPAGFLPPATAPTSDGPSLKGVGVGVAVVLGSLVGLAFG